MKTVTIPTCANPFVVIVNGIKYTYPAGETVEVPDEVAEVIEQHEEAKPEPAPVQPPYSGDDILAAAKAYTDKKVAEGGGSAQSKPLIVEITSKNFSEVSTALSSSNALSNEEIAALDKAYLESYENVLPVKVRFKWGEYTEEAVMFATTYFGPDGSQGDTKMFFAITYQGMVQIVSSKGKWYLTKVNTSNWG